MISYEEGLYEDLLALGVDPLALGKVALAQQGANGGGGGAESGGSCGAREEPRSEDLLCPPREAICSASGRGYVEGREVVGQ